MLAKLLLNINLFLLKHTELVLLLKAEQFGGKFLSPPSKYHHFKYICKYATTYHRPPKSMLVDAHIQISRRYQYSLQIGGKRTLSPSQLVHQQNNLSLIQFFGH